MWCWHCVHPIENEPLQLPYNYDSKRSKFKVTGYFCSWNCMKSYAIDKYGDTRGSIICGNIVVMRKKLFNEIGSVRCAPYRHRLNVFGGDMTIEQFREDSIKNPETRNEIDAEPMPDLQIPIIKNAQKMAEIRNSKGGNTDELRLKRNKPMKRDQNNLESALGLIIKK